MEHQRNWLTFSLYPNETNQQQNNQYFIPMEAGAAGAGAAAAAAASPQSQYLIDNFYANGYPHSKPLMGFDHTNLAIPFMTLSAAPKLENFLDSSSSMVRYTDSQTDTQDSALTHIYDQQGSAGYFNQQHTLKVMTAEGASAAGFNHTNSTFSTNSGSEVVDDSAALSRAQLAEFESGNGQSLISFPQHQQPDHTAGLALGVDTSSNNINSNNNCVVEEEKSIVAVVDSSKKTSEVFGQRTSIYRGVTRHRWTGRYEAHLWDNSCRREGQARKGRQVYLGGYDKEDKAARAYDLAALKYWGPTATTNFPVASYAKEVEEMEPMTKQEFIASLRRKSSGFSRGASIYRGVTRHHQQGRWQARIGRVAGNKDLYLGTFATEEEAAEAYDIAAIKFRGLNAVTNFEMNRYDVEAITKSALPVGGASKLLKSSLESEQKALVSVALNKPRLQNNNSSSSNISFNLSQPMSAIPCGIPFDGMPSSYQQNLYQQLQSDHAAALAMSASQNTSYSSVRAAAGHLTFLSNPAEYHVWPHQSY